MIQISVYTHMGVEYIELEWLDPSPPGLDLARCGRCGVLLRDSDIDLHGQWHQRTIEAIDRLNGQVLSHVDTIGAG